MQLTQCYLACDREEPQATGSIRQAVDRFGHGDVERTVGR